MKLDYLRLCSRASDNPGFIWFSDFTCIRSSRWVLGGSLEAGVFKLRALLGERTPKNHSGNCAFFAKASENPPCDFCTS